VKIKIDENLAATHARILAEAGHEVSDVHVESLSGATDDLLWSRVCAEGRFLVTLDTDFADVRRLAPGTHPGILLLRSTHPSVSVVSTTLRRVLAERELSALEGALAVADKVRTRIRGARRKEHDRAIELGHDLADDVHALGLELGEVREAVAGHQMASASARGSATSKKPFDEYRFFLCDFSFSVQEVALPAHPRTDSLLVTSGRSLLLTTYRCWVAGGARARRSGPTACPA
jgi:predicted nuclease of predicted toxin-antitoxin system